MATYTPPPYFPQSSLAPPDKNRYRKFKLIMVLAGVIILLALAGLGAGIWYLIRAIG
jgi:hypothetical protein